VLHTLTWGVCVLDGLLRTVAYMLQ
jgi:hypothetical protein